MTMRMLAALAAFVLVHGDALAATFDDTDAQQLRLETDGGYRLILSKTDGAIVSLIDTASGQMISSGSEGDLLWAASFPGATPGAVLSSNFQANAPDSFTYSWSAASQELTLRYASDPLASQRVDVTVTFRAADDTHLDVGLHLRNNWGAALAGVMMPPKPRVCRS